MNQLAIYSYEEEIATHEEDNATYHDVWRR